MNPEYGHFYIAFQTVTIFTDVASHEFRRNASKSRGFDSIDLLAARSHAIVESVTTFEKLICCECSQFVPVRVVKQELKIDTCDGFQTRYVRAFERKLTHIAKTVVKIVNKTLFTKSVLAKHSIGFLKGHSTYSTVILIKLSLIQSCLTFVMKPRNSCLNCYRTSF